MRKIVANIVFKSVLSKYKSIEERNAHFEELDDQGKRLEIAWDALQLVLKNKIKANNCGYWSSAMHFVSGDSKRLQEVFNSHEFFKKNECQVCARGAMMLSQIRLANSISSKDNERASGSHENLKGFSSDSFRNLEAEYEYSEFKHPYRARTRNKLANLCCNILVNGDFNTLDQTDYLTILK